MERERLSATPVDERILQLKEDFAAKKIPWTDFISQGLVLAAERLDELNGSGKEKSFQIALGNVIESEAFQGAFSYGLKGEFKFKPQKDGSIKFTGHVNYISPEAVYVPFVDSVVGGDLNKANHRKALERDLTAAGVSEELQGLIYLDILGYEAYQKTKALMFDLLDLKKILRVEPGNEESFWKNRLLWTKPWGGEGIQFCRGYIQRVTGIVQEKSAEIFPEEFQMAGDCQRAIDIWRAMIYLQTKKARRTEIGLSGVRVPIFQALAQGNLDLAEELLREQVLLMPEAFTQITKNKLGINKEAILAYKEELEKQKLALRKGRYEEIRASMREKLRQAHEQRVKDGSNEMLAKALEYEGLTLRWNHILELADGSSQERVKCLVYIIGKGARIIYANSMNEAETIVGSGEIFPVIKLKAFRLNEDGKKAKYEFSFYLLPGSFIRRVESGRYQVLGDLGDLSEASEVNL